MEVERAPRERRAGKYTDFGGREPPSQCQGLPGPSMVPSSKSVKGDSRKLGQETGSATTAGSEPDTARASGAAGPAPANSASGRGMATAATHEISASALEIPEDELTPNVRQALAALGQRIEALRREAESAQARLADVSKYADLDALLPILNRRAFVRELARFIGFTERYGTPACLFYFDVDKLKAINDFYGHAAGDAALAHFAETLKSQIRETDILARIGGDEFGVILAYSNLEQALKKGAKLEEALKKSPAKWNDQEVRLRFSYGIHKLCAGENPEDAIANADMAMYEHKRAKN
jgi:diguanylate cyclase (GGDEF)-like protein